MWRRTGEVDEDLVAIDANRNHERLWFIDAIDIAIGVATCLGRLAVVSSGRRRNVARLFASGLRFGSARLPCAAKLFGASFFANSVLAHAPKVV